MKSQQESTKQTHTANIDNHIQVLNHELACITATQSLLQNTIYLQAMIHAFGVQCAPRRQEITLEINNLKLGRKEYDERIKKRDQN